MKNYTIKEYTKIKKSEISSYQETENTLFLEKKLFQKLEIFVKNFLENEKNQITQSQIFQIHQQQANQKNTKIFELGYQYILVKNYVGVIFVENDFFLEILPKIYKPSHPDFQAEKVRQQTLKMFVEIKKIPFATLQNNTTFFNTNQKNVFYPHFLEYFISLFLQELQTILHKGLRYVSQPKTENLDFFQGKLILQEHLRHNFLYKNRFFVEFDDFTQDNLPNQTLKTTLLALKNISQNSQNLLQIQYFITQLSEISIFEAEKWQEKKEILEKSYKNNIFFGYYDKLLQFCDFFLSKSVPSYFANIQNTCIAGGMVFLWNMEQLFEQYVAQVFKKKVENENLKNGNQNLVLKIQDKKYFLAKNTAKNTQIFALKPDMVLYEQVFEIDDFVEKPTKIWDTKWKLLDKSKENFGISQEDMYQMYAYSKKYNISEICLVYPAQADFTEDFYLQFEKNLQLKVMFVG